MKNFAKTAAFVVAFIMVAVYQPAKAAGGPHLWYSSITTYLTDENSFSFELNQQNDDEVIRLSIQNPGKKNLSVSLSDPNGNTLDNFYTGRKFTKMSKQYNFTGAEEGLYTIIISDGAEKIKRQVKFERIAARPVSRLIVQ